MRQAGRSDGVDLEETGPGAKVDDKEGQWSVSLGMETLAYAESQDMAEQIASSCTLELTATSRGLEQPKGSHTREWRVLVVDDDPIQRLICRELMEQCGFRVSEASDGDQVCALLDEQSVDIVVLDMLMPNKDGLEVMSLLKELHPFTRVLAISSGGRIGSNDLLRWAKALGADAVLAKPFGAEALLLAVRSLIDQANVNAL